MGRRTKLALSLALLTVAVAVGLLNGGTTDAAVAPLCGWTAEWTCTLPDGEKVQVVGTQCEIRQFEKETGATCSL